METTGCNQAKAAGLTHLPKPLHVTDPAVRRSPLKRFALTCRAGGRGFESPSLPLLTTPS
jgi:hypothetical protein